MILILIAKNSEFNKKSTTAYFKDIEISIQKKCTVEKFRNAVAPTFNIDEQESEELFAEFNFSNTGLVNLADVISQINAYRNALDESFNQNQLEAKALKLETDDVKMFSSFFFLAVILGYFFFFKDD